jgi:hypothetical protein
MLQYPCVQWALISDDHLEEHVVFLRLRARQNSETVWLRCWWGWRDRLDIDTCVCTPDPSG